MVSHEGISIPSCKSDIFGGIYRMHIEMPLRTFDFDNSVVFFWGWGVILVILVILLFFEDTAPYCTMDHTDVRGKLEELASG